MPTDHLQQIPDNEQSKFEDKHTDERIHQHLNNEHDEITEEDIRNVRTDIGMITTNIPSAEKAVDPMPDKAEGRELTNKNNLKNAVDPGIETSWNILNE